MNSTLHKIKSRDLTELLGEELIFRKMDVEELTLKDELKNIKRKDYHECSHMLFLKDEKYKQFIKFEKDNLVKIFKNQIVVDLGSGVKPWGYYLALHGNAKAYIGIDITARIKNMLGINISSAWNDLHNNKSEIPFVSLQQEMISFLDASYKANKKYSFICSSYGKYPNDESLFSNKFFNLLIKYIPLCTNSNGGVLQNFTTFPLEGFETINNNNLGKTLYTFLKKVNSPRHSDI